MPTICIVSDIHCGVDGFSKKGSQAGPLMERFVQFCNAQQPDLVLDLGDRISDVDRDTDLRLEQEVKAMFAGIEAPIEHINGNHDRDFLSVADNEHILGQSLDHKTLDFDEWRIVLWRANTRIERPFGLVLEERDLLWLANVIKEADRPLAIFSHVPIAGQSMDGNYYFDRNQEASSYPNAADRVRSLIASARQPLAWFSGHVHWNTLTWLNGQPHFTIQSLTESWTTYPHAAESHALLRLDDQIRWQVFGRDPFEACLDAKASMQRWLPPIPPFDEHPEHIRLRVQKREQSGD